MTSVDNACKISLDINENTPSIIVNIDWKNVLKEKNEFHTEGNSFNPSTFELWLQIQTKTVLEQDCLPSSIHFSLKHEIFETHPELSKTIEAVNLVLQNSLKKIQTLKEDPVLCSSEKKGFLFLNISNSEHICEIFNHVHKTDPQHTHKLNYEAGWNKLTRRWEQSHYPDFNEIIEIIKEKQIQSIFSVNMYIVHNLFTSEQILALPILKHLGIEFISMDFDVYDLAINDHYLKALFTHKDCRRFSVFPSLCSYLDDQFKLNNIRYYNYIDTPELESKLNLNTEDFNIIFISQARLPQVIQTLPLTLVYLSHVDENNIFDDYQWLYFALNHLVFYSDEYSLNKKIEYNILFSNLYLSAMTLLKYEVIANIDKKNKIELYGDLDWKKVFPQYYQNRFLTEEEMKSKLSSGKYLYILFNQNFSSFESNPVFHRAINYSCAYLTFPALSHIQELKSLELLEYKNISELNEKTKQISSLIHNPGYQQALTAVKHYTHACYENLLTQIVDKECKTNLYNHFTIEHEKVFLAKLETYLQKNYHRVEECFNALTQKNPKQFRIENSAFSNKTYLHQALANYSQQ